MISGTSASSGDDAPEVPCFSPFHRAQRKIDFYAQENESAAQTRS
jgi:hypothetical protein